jgi:hypothetical protein
VRRLFIRFLLPVFFCVIPILGAVGVAAAVPPQAQQFYLDRLFKIHEGQIVGPNRESGMDWLILSLGTALFVSQMVLAWRALQWRGTSFDERGDRWLSNLAQAAEWFPMLGLIGTVAGIMQTFSSMKPGTPPAEIIRLYAPAITATGSGLFMALFNLLPAWIVLLGREVISSLGGAAAKEARP